MRSTIHEEEVKLNKLKKALAEQIPLEQVKIAQEKAAQFKVFQKEIDRSMTGILE